MAALDAGTTTGSLESCMAVGAWFAGEEVALDGSCQIFLGVFYGKRVVVGTSGADFLRDVGMVPMASMLTGRACGRGVRSSQGIAVFPLLLA